MNNKIYDIAIIGGGAAGLAAAIELKMSSPDLSVVIIEKNDSLGKKIRATGNGRCNITNVNAEGYNEIMAFFTRIGIVTRTYDSGLVYPYSESAADVVELLNKRIAELGVEVVTNAAVEKASFEYGNFKIIYNKKEITSKKLILALGGKAGPDFGTTGDGYALAKAFGHSIVTPIPVLTSVECKDWDSSLAGIRARGVVSLYRGDSKIFEEAGEIQFTKYGLSGICVFNMTRHMRYNRAEGDTLDQFTISLDLFPGGDTAHDYQTILKPELAKYLIAREKTEGKKLINDLTFTPSQVRGWKDAQATSGGVPLDEVTDHCESKKQPGLYIIGELLDYDGPCGGYNLSNAWYTALLSAH